MATNAAVNHYESIMNERNWQVEMGGEVLWKYLKVQN